MERTKISLIDRLRDRGHVDQWGFAAFAAAGGTAIAVSKYLGTPALWVTIGAVCIMLVYAVIIARAGTGKLRSDQAGDNCYYLGLIFTLVSLAYAIFFFDPADTATTIIQGFGIALATTITGLILRVFFSQGRPDMENVEETARLEFTEAVSRLKSELGQVIVSVNEFGRQTRQAITETRNAATNDIMAFTQNSVSGLQDVVANANEIISAEAKEFAARSKRYGVSFDRVLATLERHAERLDSLNDAQEALTSSLSSVSNAASSAQQSVQEITAKSDDATAGLQLLRQGGEQVRTLMEGLQLTVGGIDEAVTRFHKQIQEQLQLATFVPGEAVEKATEVMTEAAAKFRQEVEGLSVLHKSVTSSLSADSALATATAKRHNTALEAELQKSREYVDKVHSELLKMTEVLAGQLERR